MEVGLVVLGAVLALATSVVMEFVRQGINQRRAKKLLSSLLRDEIESLVDTLTTLVNETNQLGYIPLVRISDITSTRQGFDRNRDWIILYKDEKLRRQLFGFYQDLARCCSQATALETLKGDPKFANRPEIHTHSQSETQKILGNFRDTASAGRTLLADLKNVR